MGNPNYHVTDGEIFFGGENITKEAADKRARLGMFLSFQNPLEVPESPSPTLSAAPSPRGPERTSVSGISIKTLKKPWRFSDMDPSYGFRDLNVGFSGGEKRAEILQLLLLNPSLAILDETDSGLDVDAVRTVSKGIEEYQKSKRTARSSSSPTAQGSWSLSMWTKTHVLVDGRRLVAEGDGSLVDEINENGFEQFIASCKREGREQLMKEKTYVEDVDRNMYDFRNDEKDAYRIKTVSPRTLWKKISEEKHDPGGCMISG